jgi:hypothetical protein
MTRHQLQRSAPHMALLYPMISANPLLHSARCARVSILLSDVPVVALSARQSHTFQSRLSSLVRNVAESAASSCLARDSRQGIFRFIRYTSLNPRGGTSRSIVKPTAHEAAQPSKSCAARCEMPSRNRHQCAAAQTSNLS